MPNPQALSAALALGWTSVGLASVLLVLAIIVMPFSTAKVNHVVSTLVSIALPIFLLYKLHRRRNWARIAIIVLTLIGVPFYFAALWKSIGTDAGLFWTAPNIIVLVQVSLGIGMVALLFQRSVRTHFKAENESAQSSAL